MAEKKIKSAAHDHEAWMYLWIVLYLWPWITPADADESSVAKQGCNDRCGDVIVPYPFGIHDLICAKNQSFFLNCSHTTSDSSPTTLLFYGNPVTNVSVQHSTMVASVHPALDCYNGNDSSNHLGRTFNLMGTPFTISNTRNKLTVVGCDALALMGDSEVKFGGGCLSLCTEPQNFTNESTCSGVGCCETQLPDHVKALDILLMSISNHTTYGYFSPCSYAFLVDTNTSLDLPGFNLFSTTPQYDLTCPMVFDWVFSSDPDCDQACTDNADCIYSDNGRGYNCKCRRGYETTNPYLSKGCQDIDECKEPDKYPCHGRCKNTMGNYTCDCPFGMKGNGIDSCQLATSVKITAVVGSIIILLVFILLIFIICKRRMKLRNFINNGGIMLKHQRVRIFSKIELEKATQNFNNAKLLGEGGFGFVYKGVLEDNLQIAVKTPKDENKIEVSKDFHHEINTVSQVNHKNVVKLLGLCLETKVPLLVYEYVSNGSLFQHIHDKRSSLLRSWKNRLRVAAETALALDYLHSLADPPIIHRDVKSMNILLDENHTAKVSDFGASVLISAGEITIGTNVQGTLGYIDPEYLMTGILTDKSDVYSFGVVLVELLTGEKPTSSERSGEKRNIIQYFISVAESKDVLMILDFNVGDEGEKEEIGEVAELAKRCLHASGIKRPSMKEVAEELASLMKLNQRFWTQQSDTEETEHLLGESSDNFIRTEKAKSQMGQQYSYTDHQTSFDIESMSMPSI